MARNSSSCRSRSCSWQRKTCLICTDPHATPVQPHYFGVQAREARGSQRKAQSRCASRRCRCTHVYFLRLPCRVWPGRWRRGCVVVRSPWSYGCGRDEGAQEVRRVLPRPVRHCGELPQRRVPQGLQLRAARAPELAGEPAHLPGAAAGGGRPAPHHRRRRGPGVLAGQGDVLPWLLHRRPQQAHAGRRLLPGPVHPGGHLRQVGRTGRHWPAAQVNGQRRPRPAPARRQQHPQPAHSNGSSRSGSNG